MNEETKMPSPKEALEQWLDSNPLNALLPPGSNPLPDDPRLSYRTLFATLGDEAVKAINLAFINGYVISAHNVLEMAKAETVKAGKTPIDESQVPTTPQ